MATTLRMQTTALADALERSNDVDRLLQTRLRLAACARLGDCSSGAARKSPDRSDPGLEADAAIADRVTALSAAVRSRAAALNALAAAYAIFEDEASGAKASHLAQAVGAAAQAARGYASAPRSTAVPLRRSRRHSRRSLRRPHGSWRR